jgi:hypothetical protein
VGQVGFLGSATARTTKAATTQTAKTDLQRDERRTRTTN